ncbi:MAG: hypothetical protein ACXQTP_06130 [Candidatus Methanofastidiosia archaeon]
MKKRYFIFIAAMFAIFWGISYVFDADIGDYGTDSFSDANEEATIVPSVENREFILICEFPIHFSIAKMEYLLFDALYEETVEDKNCEEAGKTIPVKTAKYPLHEGVTVTIFWVGESASEENGFISNTESAWDDKWVKHFGDVDNPDNRSGYFPANFTPLENPFYFALPYNDFDESGIRKIQAYQIVYWANEKIWGSFESMLKNRWIKIVKGDLVAYAQWEDVGPFGEGDGGYVFGNLSSFNKINDNAGLDVSPAVRDFLELSDIDVVSWQFVDFEAVLDGPWKQIVTTSSISWE